MKVLEMEGEIVMWFESFAATSVEIGGKDVADEIDEAVDAAIGFPVNSIPPGR